MLVTIKSNQACLNAPFGSILLTFEGDELVRCELSEEAVEEDLGISLSGLEGDCQG